MFDQLRNGIITRLFRDTGCNIPCSYKKFYKTKVLSVLDQLTNNSYPQETLYVSDRSGVGGLQFGFSSTSVTVKEEAEVYFHHFSQAQVQVLELNLKYGLDLEHRTCTQELTRSSFYSRRTLADNLKSAILEPSSWLTSQYKNAIGQQ